VELKFEKAEGQSKEGGSWKMTAPVAEELDATKVARLVDLLKKVDASRFVAPVAKAPEYGLDQPSITLTMTSRAKPGTGGEPAAYKLLLADKDGKLYALVDGEPLIFEMGRGLVEFLEKPMGKEPWGKFDQDRASVVELFGPDIKLDFVRAGKEWTAENAPDFKTNSSRVTWYLGDLAGADAAKIVAYAAKDLAAYGLDKPQWRVHVKGLGFDKTFLVSDKGPTPDKYATIEGSARVVVLDASTVARIAKDKSNFNAGQQ